jgi:hypothetical protein
MTDPKKQNEGMEPVKRSASAPALRSIKMQAGPKTGCAFTGLSLTGFILDFGVGTPDLHSCRPHRQMESIGAM